MNGVDQPTPREDLRAIITKLCEDAATTGINHPAFPAHREHMIEAFLATWYIEKPTEIAKQRAAQSEWQREAKLVIALLLTAMNNVAPQLGDTVLAEAEKIVVARGLDPEEVLARFTP
ncbi:hypothetical protein KNU79_gp09 [Gordonia phage NadineRae]|uniref:Uncharacterized protein n=1 Tax=Gordonia phage NadineRae TaxID=2652882 RepID=A0A5P8DFD3_9CAUD|nr:hypothetical protein KNU79_gp09 [Gordonia phage NadineRae]QFP97697.1 hypothetical protein SEA_NADINERAE_9 [Gordonia phage NadineRae]